MAGKWNCGTLADIAEIVMGQSPPGTACNSVAEGLPLLNGPTEFGGNHPAPVQFTTDPRKFAKPNDLLFCVRGSTTGRMNWADQDYAIGRGIAAIRSKSGAECRSFVRAVVENKLPMLLAAATGSTFPNVSRNQLLELECEIPPLPCQKRIAHILGTLDDKIELNRRMNATLEEMARALFRSWFVDFDPVRAKADGRQPIGLEPATAALFPDSFQDSPLGPIPSGWNCSTLGEACKEGGGGIQTGPFGSQLHAADYVAEGIPSIMPKDLRDNRIDTSSIARIRESDAERLSKYRVQTGDVVYSRRGDVERRSLIRTAEDGWLCGTGCLRVRFGPDGLEPQFGAACLGTLEARAWVVRHAVGATMPNLNTSILGALPIITPPNELQTNFSDIAGTLDTRASKALHENRNLADIRDTLLPKLLSGELDVSKAKEQAELAL